MATMDFSGFDELDLPIDELQSELDKLTENSFVSFEQLFPTSFMQEHSSFSTFDELLDAGGFIVQCQEDFDAIPIAELDKHISLTTDFKNWDDMFEQASVLYSQSI